MTLAVLPTSEPFPGTFDNGALVDANKHKPPVPEPREWGLITVGFCLLLFVYIRFVRPRNRCACHHHS